MKTLVNNLTNISLYVFEDDEILDITNESITVGNPPKFIIGDCNSENITLHTNVTVPEDWYGCKYLYVNNEWVLNNLFNV